MKYKFSMWRQSILAANVSLIALSASMAIAQEEVAEETTEQEAEETTPNLGSLCERLTPDLGPIL